MRNNYSYVLPDQAFPIDISFHNAITWPLPNFIFKVHYLLLVRSGFVEDIDDNQAFGRGAFRQSLHGPWTWYSDGQASNTAHAMGSAACLPPKSKLTKIECRVRVCNIGPSWWLASALPESLDGRLEESDAMFTCDQVDHFKETMSPNNINI